jgi:hypothetical protein
VLPRLRRTWFAVALALLAFVPLALLAGRGLVRDLYPECRSKVDALGTWPRPGALESVAWGEPSGFADARFELRKSGTRGRFGRMVDGGVEIVRVDCGVDGEPAVTCGAARLPGAASTDEVELSYDPVNRVYFARVSGEPYARRLSEPEAFVVSNEPTRHFQKDRLLSSRRVPDLVVLFSFVALAVAAFRARRAAAYATRMHTWTEASLRHDGVLQDESGSTLAMLESTARRVPPGPVLVDPAALQTGSIYRTLPIVPRRQVAAGSHARWVQGTLIRLRDARGLAAISVACTALAVFARLVG